jgi:hypothetical protein
MARVKGMTARNWNACRDPDKMLHFLGDRASARKFRLFGCACCRRIEYLFADERRLWALGVAERFADGQAKAKQLRAALRVMEETRAPGYGPNATWAAWYCCRPLVDAGSVHRNISLEMPHDRRRDAEIAAQAALLREVFGNPRRPVVLDPAWLAWRDGLVPAAARRMYETRDFGDMPVLADMLEEAGCVVPQVLAHCRGPGPHVPGCFLIDLLLQRE